MTDEQREAIRLALNARVREAEQNPELARERLVREGFYTRSGNLTGRYSGRRTATR